MEENPTTTPAGEAARAAASGDAPVPDAEASGDASPATPAEPTAAAGDLPSSDQVLEALKEVIDPEIGLNIVDLGLIYEVIPKPDTGHVDVNMTLTSPGCPAGPEITSAVWMTVKRMGGVKDCEVNLVWKPRWDPTVHPSEEARMFLGIW